MHCPSAALAITSVCEKTSLYFFQIYFKYFNKKKKKFIFKNATYIRNLPPIIEN